MAERITWKLSGSFSWEGQVGNQIMVTLTQNAASGVFTLWKPSTFGGLEIDKGSDASILKAKAEAMLQDLADQGLPLE